MGFSGRKYVLPAPTESIIDSNVDEAGVASEDIATDLSRRTDRTSATIPEDGSPVTITTAHKTKAVGSSKTTNTSQTSLLIEYYEGADKSRRPSLRVRMRPSSKTGQAAQEGHIVVSQQGPRKASYTKRIPLTANTLRQHGDEEDIVGFDEIETYQDNRSAPIDIEIGSKGSDFSGVSHSPEVRYIVPGSDISSMPADSMLGTGAPAVHIQPAASSILTKSDMPRSVMSDMPDSTVELKPPIIPVERNRSHERITQKAIEKLSSKDRGSTRSGRRHSDKSRSRKSGEVIASSSTDRRLHPPKNYAEESTLSTGTDPSQISNSAVSAGAKSVGSSASNITNPKLLQTVEDAIRRLILPELIEIKRNGSRRHAHKDEEYSDISENSIAREKEQSRRVSSGSKSRRRSSKGHGSSSRRRHHRDYDYDSLSDISSPRKESISSTSDHHRSRNLAAGAVAGAALTAAVLHHHDSTSTLDQDRERRRRRKRSKSRSSRGTSVNESEEIFDKHDVPPMPFVSEIGSELTRSSLLSSNTVSTTTPTQRDVRETIRGSPLTGNPPVPFTPTRNSGDLRNSLGLHHKNISGHDVGVSRDSYQEHVESPGSPDEEFTPETVRELPYTGSPLIGDLERLKQYEQNLHQQHPIRRGLSPIQSVASYATTEHNRHSVMHAHSVDSIASMKQRQQALKEEVSMDSFSSASPDLKKQTRPQGIHLENRSEIMHPHGAHAVSGSRALGDEYSDDDEDEYSQHDEYRDSYATSEGLQADTRHLSGYTDDSVATPTFDKVGAGQQVARGFASHPEYVHTPPGVESAVASLIEPSVLDLPDSAPHSIHESTHSRNSFHSPSKDVEFMKSGSPLREQIIIRSQDTLPKARQLDSSPPQSPARSFEEGKDGGDVLNSAEQQVTGSPESEITTNPSVIHGPIGGGLATSNPDHWQYAPTPERTIPNFPAQQALNRDLGMHAPDLIPEALNVSQRNTFNAKPDPYTTGLQIGTPPGIKDEGYATGDTGNHRSPGPFIKPTQPELASDDLDVDDDPFIAKRNQYISGMSQGMSPLYDAATGKGIDRIHSKDVVALMNHLTVRDAQRNARDTEILVTLVRSAAEMRNQFEDMKKFITEQDELLVGAGERQHEKTMRVIGGPRPQPASRSVLQSATSQDDLPGKRRNIFMRAVQRLGSKNETELQNIEQMLMKLLGDVEELRRSQGGQQIDSTAPQDQHMQSRSLASVENARTLTDPGYEPEGQAGTSSTGDRSGLQSGNSSRQTDYRVSSARKEPTNRVSTVMEGDEEYDDYDDGQEGETVTPRASPGAEAQYRQSRGQSAPVQTTPKMQGRLSGPWSNDNNPQYTYEPSSAGRKHKSIASSFFGKGGLMSRWSKTTASTMPDNRQSTQKARPYSQVSRSGSDLAGYEYEPQAEDQLLNQPAGEYGTQENRPPSPLVPSQVSEHPKYQGYRNSQNLQHPQPRQGPTGRYQYHLESEAVTYDNQFSPTSQTSSRFEAQPSVAHVTDYHHYAPQPPLSPISDAGYSESSTTSSRRGPPRPPKEVDNDPLVPQRSIKGTMSPSTYVEHVAAARGGSPAYTKSPVLALRSPQGSQNQRKPSGPRPLSSPGQYNPSAKPVRGDLNTVKKTRFRGSPYQIDSTEDLHRA